VLGMAPLMVKPAWAIPAATPAHSAAEAVEPQRAAGRVMGDCRTAPEGGPVHADPAAAAAVRRSKAVAEKARQQGRRALPPPVQARHQQPVVPNARPSLTPREALDHPMWDQLGGHESAGPQPADPSQQGAAEAEMQA
jgi:hypothetical protein